MSLPIFIQKEMHDKKVDQLFVQISVRIENKKSNPAMQALFGKPVATKQEKKNTIQYYQHIFTKIQPHTNTSWICPTIVLILTIILITFIQPVKKNNPNKQMR